MYSQKLARRGMRRETEAMASIRNTKPVELHLGSTPVTWQGGGKSGRQPRMRAAVGRRQVDPGWVSTGSSGASSSIFAAMYNMAKQAFRPSRNGGQANNRFLTGMGAVGAGRAPPQTAFERGAVKPNYSRDAYKSNAWMSGKQVPYKSYIPSQRRSARVNNNVVPRSRVNRMGGSLGVLQAAPRNLDKVVIKG